MNAEEYNKPHFTDDFMYCKILTNNMNTCHKMLELIIGEKAGRCPIQITADGKGIHFNICSEGMTQEEDWDLLKQNTNAVLKEGETYSFGGYEWICAEVKGNYAVMQSTGVTAGVWPGYKMSKFGNGDFYANSIDGQDISAYDDKTTTLYNSIRSAEYVSATYGKGLFLVSNEKAGTTTTGSKGSGNYHTALKTAANSGSFGASYSYAWLGTVYGSSNAWGVNQDGNVYNGSFQNSSFVVAPAFNLDTSKITLDGSKKIILGGSKSC